MIYLAIAFFFLFAYLGRKRPILALAGIAALLPIYNFRFEIVGLPTTILEFIIWGAFLGFVSSLRAKRGNLTLLKERLQKIKYPLVVFFLASVIAIFISPSLYKAFGLWRAFILESGLVFLMILAVIKNKDDFQKIIFGLSVSALFISIVSFGQKFFGLPNPFTEDPSRMSSVFIQPNMVGLYLGPIIILMIGKIFITGFKKSFTTYYLLLTTVLSLAAIVLAKSDGAIIAVTSALAIFLFLWNKTSRRVLVISALLLTTCYLLLPNNNFSLIKEKLLFGEWSGFVRLNIWRESWEMLKDNWLFGAGIGGYPLKILPYHASREWMDVFPHPHNFIFNFWSELGLLGLAGFLWLLEKFGVLCYTLLRKDRLLAITVISAMSAILIHGLVDVPFFKNDLSILFWIIYAMPIVCHPRPSDSENIRGSS